DEPRPRAHVLLAQPKNLFDQDNANSGKGHGDESQVKETDWIEARTDGKHDEASCTENPQKKDRDTENNLQNRQRVNAFDDHHSDTHSTSFQYSPLLARIGHPDHERIPLPRLLVRPSAPSRLRRRYSNRLRLRQV